MHRFDIVDIHSLNGYHLLWGGRLAEGLACHTWFARCNEAKRLLVAGFCKVAARYPDAPLRIAGPSDRCEAAKLRRIASEAGFSDQVEVSGSVYGEDRDRLMRSAGTFALIFDDENYGAAPVEAAAQACYVLASAEVPSTIGLIDGGGGERVKPNVAAVAAALERLLADPALVLCGGERAQQARSLILHDARGVLPSAYESVLARHNEVALGVPRGESYLDGPG